MTQASQHKLSSFMRNNAKKLITTTAITALGVSGFSGMAKAADDWSDHVKVGGDATITIDSTSVANTTNITQSGHRVKVQGDGDIKAGWTVNLDQDSSSSQYILFDVENDPTFIRGNLNANGQVFIFDNQGVIFTDTSQVDVGAIVASSGTLASTDADLDAGKILINSADGDGEVINQGSITVAEGGLAAFVSPAVSNSGIINARMGNVVMGAGEVVTLDLYGDGLVEIAVDGELADGLISNTGDITANGGNVLVTASVAKEAVDNVINMDGVVDVSSVTQKGGKIILSGGNAGKVQVSGTLDASGTEGGEIEITGESVHATETAELKANADENGDGGTAYIYGNNYAIFEGKLEAKGGSTSGDGGNVEISGGEGVGYNGSVDLTAANGSTGTLLIDPKHIILNNTWSLFGFSFGPDELVTIYDQALANTLRTANVNLWATEDISTGSDIDISTWSRLVSCGFFCLTTEQGITGATPGTGNLTIAAPEVNLTHDIILGEGQLNVADILTTDSVFGFGFVNPSQDIIVDTLNLDGLISKRTSVGGATTLADDGQINTTADNINVLSSSASIQQGIQFADASDAEIETVNVGDDTWNENVVVDRSLNLNGTGTTATTIIDGTGLDGHGVTVAADNVSLNGFIVENFNGPAYYASGIGVETDVNNLSIDDVVSRNNKFAGLYVANAANLDGLNVTNSHFDQNVFGWYLEKGDNNALNTSTVTNVVVSDTTFNENSRKGIYAEKLENASFTDVDVIDSGTDAGNPFGNVGVDINLKNGDYENIMFNRLTVSGSGLNTASKRGTAVSIKGRNDGGYAATPGTLTGLEIKNSDITAGGDVALGLGYGIDGGDVRNSNITGPEGVVIYGGATDILVRNNTISSDGQGYSSIGQNVGVAISASSGNKIRGNTILTDDDGIIVDNSSARIVENTITGPGTTDTAKNGVFISDSDTGSDETVHVLRNTITGFGEGVDIRESSSKAIIKNNFINGNAEGVNIGEDADGTKVTIYDNDLSGNTKGVENRSGEIVNASFNWWGSNDENVVDAYMMETNGGIDFSPYQGEGTDTDLSTKGYQGNFGNLWVTTLGAQTSGLIQEAVDAAWVGGDINVNAGLYEEAVDVWKTVNLYGANRDIAGYDVRGPESIVTGASPAWTVNADNVVINGFTMDGPTLTYGVLLNDVKGIEVANNIISRSSVAAIGGVVDHDDAVQVDLLVEGNKIDDSNTGDGVNIAGDGAGSPASPALVGSRVDIVNNIIGGDGSYDGNATADGVGGSAIVFGTIGDPAGLVDTHWGYDVTTASEINITSNFLRAQNDGVRFGGGVDEANINISGNSQITGLNGKGVSVVGDLTNSDLDVNGNGTISGTAGAIAFDGHVDGSDVEIDGNTTIFSALADAIKFSGITNGSTVAITNNTSTNGALNGINFGEGSPSISGSSVDVSSNTIHGAEDGIHIAGEIVDSTLTIGKDSLSGNTITAGSAAVGNSTNHDGIYFGGDITGATRVLVGWNDIDALQTTGSGSTGFGDMGIRFDGFVNTNVAGTSGVGIVGNEISAGEGQGDRGISFWNGIGGNSTVRIAGNTIEAGDDGIGVFDTIGTNKNDSVRGDANLIISGNTIGTSVARVGTANSGDGNGIDFQSVTGNSNVTISGNDVWSRKNAVEFDKVVDTTGEIDISDNTNLNASAEDGIQFAAGIVNAMVTIAGNASIVGGSGDGIFFGGGSPSVTDANITVSGNTLIQGSANGIHFEDEVTGNSLVTIRNNDEIDGNNGAGILFAGDVNSGASPVSQMEIHIDNNTITGSQDGILFAGNVSGNAHDQRIERNTITGESRDGVRYEGTIEQAHVRILNDNDITGREDGVDFVGAVQNNARVTINDNESIVGELDDGIDFHTTLSDATVRINGNHNILGDGGGPANSPSAANGIEFAAIDGSTVEIRDNNDGIRGDDHGIYFGGSIYGGADIDIHDNIISADENNDGLGDGIHFASNIFTAAINIGDGNGATLGSSPSNFIQGEDGIHFAGELNSGTMLVIDGNRIGYLKGGPITEDSVNDDGIQFARDIQGSADVKITDNWINADDDGINFGDDIQDDARVLIGGNGDGNTIFANDEGIQFGDEVKDHSLLEISHNDIEADENGIQFNGATSNHIHSGNSEEILIAYNSIESNDGHGILFQGQASNWRHDIMIRNNTKIHGHDGDGIRHEGGIDDAELTIRNNDDVFGKYDAIHVEGAFRNNAKILITENTDIDTRYGDGIEVTQSGGAGGVDLDITRNHIHYVGDNGVEVDNVNDADISRNRIHDTGNDGINVEGGYDVAIYRNDIDDTDGNGIFVKDSNEAYVSWNDVDGTGENGIYINSSDNVDVFGNEIDDTDEHGIKVNPSDYINIAYNRIHDAGWDGINVQDGRYADIYENHVHRVGDDGIDVNGNYKVDINDNVVKNTGRAWWSVDGNGIEVSNSFDADILDNYVEYAGDDGIDVERSAFSDIRGNEVRYSGDDGIDVENSRFVDINGNHVHGARGDGIEVQDSFDADVIGNRIHYVGDDGIYARNNFGADIRFNSIHDARRDGIDVEDSNFVDVNFNLIRRVGGNGIEVQNSDFADILFNGVFEARENGIYVNPSDFVDIGYNAVFFSGQNGIDVNGGHFIDIYNNLVGFNGRDGINVDGSRHVDIMNNISFANRGDGIDVNANHYGYHYTPNEINITGNRTNFNGDNGIEVSGDSRVNGIELLVDGNTTNENGNNGIEILADAGFYGPMMKVSTVSLVGPTMPGDFNSVISNNISENNTNNGLYVAGGGHNDVEVSGNTFTENDIGATFESGTIDLTGTGNLFDGGRIGMRFAPAIIGYELPTSPTLSLVPLMGDPIYADMSLVGNTIGSQTFDGQSELYVELDNGAFFNPGTPTLLNALDSTYVGTPFGTVTPSADFASGFTLEQLAFFESMFEHFNDNGSTGLFFFPLLPAIDQEDIFQYFGPNAASLSGLNVTILSLPLVPGGVPTPVALNNIAPAAGADFSPEALSAIAPAAGGDEGTEGGTGSSCFSGSALAAAGNGQAVTVSYGGGAEGLLNAEDSCGS